MMCVVQLVGSEQQLEIEAAAIEFFSSVISCHAKNQLTFALILCDVIQTQRNVIPGQLCSLTAIEFTSCDYSRQHSCSCVADPLSPVEHYCVHRKHFWLVYMVSMQLCIFICTKSKPVFAGACTGWAKKKPDCFLTVYVDIE